MLSDEIEKYVKEWVKEKKGEFDYIKAVETLQEDVKHLVGLGINDTIHFDFGIQDIVIRLEYIDTIQGKINKDDINLILELVNTYHYYLNINQEFSKQNNDIENIEKLNEIIKLFDDDFIDFLDKYLYLDKTLTLSSNFLKITKGHKGVIKYYLSSDFILSLRRLQRYFKNKKAKNETSIRSKDTIGIRYLKPKIAYTKELSQRLILKSLLFELLLCSSYRLKSSFTKKTSLYIIDFFFNKEWEARFKHKELETLAEPSLLSSKKAEQSLNKETIECIQTYKLGIYDEIKKYYHSDIPKHIKALMELNKIKSLLEKRFKPLLTSNY